MSLALARTSRCALALVLLLLACGAASVRGQTSGTFEPFDRWYGVITLEDQMAHLDNFAIELKRDPKLLGYILVFSGKISCRGAAEARGNILKRYLVETSRIPADRIVVKDAGYAAVQTVVLLPLTPGAKAPNWPYYEPPSKEHTVEECKPYEVLWPVFDTKLRISPSSFLTVPAGYHAYIGPIMDDSRAGWVGVAEEQVLFTWTVDVYENPFAEYKSFA